MSDHMGEGISATMTFFLVLSCVVCAWAMLRVVGGERTQGIREIESRLKKEAEKPKVDPDEPITVGGPDSMPQAMGAAKPAPPPAKPSPPAAKKPPAPAQKAKH
jgi:hypothetical protein